jgi:very-short-patch-repair endonuclease
VRNRDVPGWHAALTSDGGIARQAALMKVGCDKRELAEAVAAGHLLRIRRSWLALRTADPMLIGAARAGVILTCVTRAKRLGLWVTAEDRPHVAARASAGGVRLERKRMPGGALGERSATVHWAHPVLPRPPHVLEDSVENALVLVAGCQPREDALAVWESALNKRLVDPVVLRGLKLPAFARSLLDQATPFADSGLETIVPMRLRWLGVRIIHQVWLYGHRVDFLMGKRLVLQIDGGHHVGAQRASDIRHDAELMLRGYHVIRVGYADVMHDWPAVQQLIMTAIAQGRHLAA